MAQMPLEPSLSRALLAAVHFGCLPEMLAVASMLSVENVFTAEAPPSLRDAREAARADDHKRAHVRACSHSPAASAWATAAAGCPPPPPPPPPPSRPPCNGDTRTQRGQLLRLWEVSTRGRSPKPATQRSGRYPCQQKHTTAIRRAELRTLSDPGGELENGGGGGGGGLVARVYLGRRLRRPHTSTLCPQQAARPP